MRLSDYMRSDLVMLGLRGRGVEEAIGEMASRIAAAGMGPSEEEFRERLLARERAHTTAMGHGVAIPHATIEGLPSPSLAIGLAEKPIPFGPGESDDSQVFFVLVSPPGRESEHIKLLARICRLVRHTDMLESLLEAQEPADVLRAVEVVDGQHV